MALRHDRSGSTENQETEEDSLNIEKWCISRNRICTILPLWAHYFNPSRYVQIKLQVSKAIERTLIEQNLRYIEVTTRFTDDFYRETAEKVE